jgi:hypothetical protein
LSVSLSRARLRSFSPRRPARACCRSTKATAARSQYGSAGATVAKQWDDPLGQYGWGAAATFAKQQTRDALAANADNEFLAQYGWGAAATYAKLHI